MASIYALVDSRTPSEYRYIGKTVKTLEHRLYHHKYKANRDTNLHKVRWMNKVEAEGAEVLAVLIEECADSEQDAREIHWIRKCRDEGYELTNMSDGGEGGINPLPDVIDKIRKALIGRKRPAHVVEALRENGKRYVGAANPNYGKTHTEEAKRRIVAGRVGVPLCDEHKSKLSIACRGKNAKLTPELVLQIFDMRKTGMSQQSIADVVGVHQTRISSILRGNGWSYVGVEG